MALSSLLIPFLFIGTRAIWVQERPVLETRDGHLLISSAKDRNISLLTFGASTVNINDINLVEVSINARKAAATVKNWENQILGTLIRDVNQLSSDMGVVQQRLGTLDFGGDGTTNSSATRPGRPSIDNDDFASSASVGQLSLRVRRMERSLKNIRNKLRENGCAGSPCDNGGTCIRVFDGFQCICPSNWEGQTCAEDVNECAIFAGTDLGCQNGATCTNLRGSYRCSCKNGWHGIHCNTKLSTCEAQDSAELCGHGICIPSSGDLKYTCICDQGWESDGSSPACRKDVNECTGKHPSCSTNPLVPCFNYDGGYRCGSCPAGYTGNGHYCHDINECLVDNGGCSTSPRVECINSIGSWSCGDCPAGYQGDGVTCNYVGACRINNGGCSPQATCVETSGYVQCNCRPGFHGTGVGSQGCHAGTDMISPCSSNPCIHGTCHPSGDHFVCRCNPRFTGIICDKEVNPCSPNPCQNGGTCRSTDSSTATCNCTSAYTGSRCEVQRQSCNALYKNPSGTLEYPSNGMVYEHGLNCAFVILLTNTSLVLNITITRFDFEKSQNCRFDFLQIHDGQNAGAHQIGRFCGTNLPFGGNFITTHNAVYFWMRTDSSDAHRGFAIRWESIEPECGGLMTADNGRIASPGSPGQYPHNRDCWWSVLVRPGKRIQFHFYSVMIEEHPTCDYDYLEINETAGNRLVQLGLYCNHTHPDPLLTSGSSAILHFHSDGAGSDMGFQISYSTVEGTPGCGGVFTADHGTITTPGYPSYYPPRLICDWKIQLPKGEKIRLTWMAFDIERQRTCRFDAVQVFSGPDTDSPVVGRYCGDELPASVVIESNVALIVFTSDWSLQKRGFQLKYETVCGGVFNDPTGILKSPYYPEDYPGSRTCLYEIVQPAGKGIILSIVDMEIEGPIGRTCYFDGLNIYDGDNDNSTLLGSLCGQPGNIPSEPYFSTHNYMFLKFFTDGSAHNRGFLANYTTVDRRCGGLLKEPSGLIRSHAVGETYGENEDCTWTLKAPKGHIVQLGFTTFSLEGGTRCIADYVSVYDTSKGQEMGRFCGSNLPPTLTTQGESMTVTFHSDFSVSHEGFIAHYVFVDATKICGAHYFTTTGVIVSPNYPKSYPPNKECVWVITAPQKQQVILEVNQFDLEGLNTCHFDSLEIRNGGTEFSPLIGKYCGTNIPRRIKSLTHEIYLKFTSDSSRQMGGFNISWDTSTFGCGGVLNGSKGEIMSPGYPQPYIRLANCLWTIAVSEGSKVQLVMVDFDLEGHQRCRYDYMEISTGVDEHRRNGDRYCGTNHPSVITLDSNLVTIRFRSDYSNSGRGFHIRYETLCYNKVRGFNGVIESPNFPNRYPNSANCTWTIEAPKGNKINLTFSHFELESPMRDGNCSFDYLQISEGENDEPNTELGTYCGTDLPPLVSSTVNQVFVHFSTDAYFTHGGFRLEWMVVGCGGYLKRPYGEITSPGYPNGYQENIECEWLIELDHGHSVQISFVDVSTEKYTGCKFDKIQLFSGIDANAPKLAEFCHSEGPINYTSSTNKLFIKFESDSSYVGRGFKAQYESVVLECGGKFHAPQGVIHSTNYPNNYPANQNCEWLISVDRNHLVNLTFSDFDIEDTTNCTDDYVKVFDGASRDDLLLGTYCRNDLPPSIISSGDKLLVAMRSDSLVGAKGFKAQFSKACGARVVTDGTGTLESTSLLHMENEEVNCTWTIVAKDPANHVTLNIFYMELDTDYDIDSECRDHFIQVYEGDGIDGPSLGRWCANKAPPSIISNGYALTVHLYATYGIVDDKFGATYSVLDSTCGGEYISASGAFSSPNYPENYIVNATCIWMLNTSPGNRISLTFTEFELEQSPNCDRDYLEIRENSGIGKLIGIYCTGVPEPIVSSTKLWIKFRSDDVGSAKGFRADYTFLHGNELTGMSGEIATPLYPRDWKLKDDINWRITVTFGMAVRLEFDVVRMERLYDECLSRVTIYDGYDENAPLVSTVCGMMPPKDPIISSSNVIYIQFTSQWVRDSNLFHLNWYQVPRETTIDNGETRLSECEVEYDLTSIDNNTVTFWSPGFPEGYADNLDCTWVITTTPGSHLNMRFIRVDLEETQNCVNDYASVYNGHGLAETLDDTQLIAKVCRSNDTNTKYTAKTVMTVKFHSDYYINGTGIKAFVWRECGGDLSGPNGVIDFNITKRMYDRRMMTFRCEWNITVRQGKTIEVKFTNFKIENTDASGCKDNYILLKNGAGPESPLLGTGKFCGKRAPSQQLITTGNKLYVKAVGPWAQIDFKMTYKEVLKDCGGFFRVGETDDQMQFSSPNYPNIPPPFTECFWKFMAPAGGRLSLHFIERFDLTNSRNCTREYVEVRDGGTEYSILLGRFCRDTPPSTLTTTGNMLYVHFYTEVDDPKNGFKAAVTTGEVCGGILRGQTGVIRSPNYPATYPINQACGWWIDGPPDHTLKLEFRDLHLPSLRRCKSSDYVSIGERLPFNDTLHTFGDFCGSRKPDVMETSSNEAIISFHSDNRTAVNFRGFVLNYTASRETCGGALSGLSGEFKSSGYPNPNVRSRYCLWSITVPEGAQVVLDILDLDIKDTDSDKNYGLYLMIANDENSRSVITVIRQAPYQKKIRSTSRYMTIGFFYTPGHRGLRARYSAASPAPCGGPTDEAVGRLYPPVAPYNDSTFYCQWNLRAPDTMVDSRNITRTTLTVWVSGQFDAYPQQNALCDYRSKFIRMRDDHNRLGSLCGNFTDKTIMWRSPAPFNTIEILNGTSGGPLNFDVKYEWKACGGILLGPIHTIRSPENVAYPKSCVWHAKFEDPGAVIRLIFHRMNLGKGSCDKGYIIVRNGGPLSPQIGKYCGNMKPGNITSSTNQLWIEYWASEEPADFEIQLYTLSGSCGGTIRGANKEISSPGFPTSYPNNAECTWEITGELGHSIGLVFVDRFNLETSDGCANDFIQLFDWTYDDKGIGIWKEHNKMCGRNTPQVFNATSNRLKVLFRSNNAVQGDGFRALWEENCGGIFEATKQPQFIESPNYPDAYPNSKSCNYTINRPAGKKIWIEFLDFQLERTARGGDCKFDNVTIMYHRYSDRESVYCGDNIPPTLSSDRKVTVIFKSDPYVPKRGFVFKYFVNECGGDITEPTEIGPPIMKTGEYFGSLNCTWVIKAPEGKSVVLRFNQFHLEASHNCMFDQVIVTEGDTLEGQRLAKLCGNVSDPFPVRTIGNKMTVMFRSDSSGHFAGVRASVIFTKSIANGCGGTLEPVTTMPFRTQKAALYENFEDCQWTVRVTAGKFVRLTINTMDLKNKVNSSHPGCNGDFLEVRDGAGPFSSLIGRYCGSSPSTPQIPPIDSSLNALWIRFYTDGSTVGEGVTATLSAVDSPCGKNMWDIANQTEVMKSPGYPGDYPAGIHCRWVFKVHGGLYAQLRVHFEEMDMEDSKDCTGDHFEISDEPGKYISEDFGEDLIYNGMNQHRKRGRFGIVGTHTYCGKMNQFDYHSGSNEIHIILKTTAQNLPKPRKFKFEVEKATCSRNYTAEQGRIIHQDFEECWTTITAKPNETISVYFYNFRMYDYNNCTGTFLKVYQGDFTAPNPKTVCSIMDPNPIFSTGNMLSFHSKTTLRHSYVSENYDMLYTTTDKGRGCGGRLFNTAGTFTSPMYPMNYRNESMCEWEISVPRGSQVVLEFVLFDMGSIDICSTDYMEIQEKNTDTPRTETYCPGQTPATFRAQTNVVTVTSVTSVNNGGTGWVIRFRAIHSTDVLSSSERYWRGRGRPLVW